MACKKCKTEAVFTLTSGSRLCKRCFCDYFERKFRKTVRKHKLISKADNVAVGLSGGKDSIAVLSLLDKLRKQLKFGLTAILIDEGIKGYRPVTIKAAKDFCRKNNIGLEIVSFRKEFGMTLDGMVKKLGMGPCTICGTLRRYLLNSTARKLKATKLATGHNTDDEAQSIVMNTLRNNNIASARLGVITGVIRDKRFVPRIKPLYFHLEKEILAYAFLKKFIDKFVECPYANLSYRGEIRDILNELEKKHPGTKSSAVASFIELLPALKNNYAPKKGIGICEKCGEPSVGKSCRSCAIVGMLKSI